MSRIVNLQSPIGNWRPRWLAVVLVVVWTAALAQSVRSAQSLERAGQFEAAWLEYRRVVERSPQDPVAFEGYARLSLQLERAESLVVLSRRLQAADSGDIQFALGLVEGLLGLKRRAEALAAAREAARRWPGQLVLVAEALKRSREYAAAAEMLARQMAQTGFRFDLALRLVELHELDSKYGPAARQLAELANRDPGAAAGQLARLRAYGRRGAGRQVLGELAAIKDPALRDAAQAQVQLGAGNAVEAVRLMRRARTEQEFYRFGRACEDEGQLEAALAVYREMAAHADEARVLRKMGRKAEARQALTKADGPGARFELAELLREERDFGAAADAYRGLLRQQPKHAPALEGLAASELGLGRLDSAQTVLARLGQGSDRALLLAAQVFFYRGGLDSAQARVRELGRRFPQSRLVNDGLELVLLCQVGEGAAALARAMLGFETGADEAGEHLAAELSRGNDVVAEQASLLLARFRRRAGQPQAALAALDSSLARPDRNQLRARTMLERALVLRDDLKDESRFRLALEELIEMLPASPYVPIARNLLAEAAPSGADAGVR